jgi:CRP/FNR family transcriptional regulator, cyclic AMP receptor protein
MNTSVPKEVELFFSKFTPLQYKRGEMILRAGDPPVGVLYLKKGFVRMSFVAPSGEMLVLHIYKAGSYFPMTWAMNKIPNRYFFQAITGVELLRAPEEEVCRFIKDHPEVLEHFMTRLLTGMSGVLGRMEHLIFESAYDKTILVLLYYIKNFSESAQKAGTLIVPLTHKEIAAWIGTTRETASIQIELLKRKKLIQYNRRFIVVPNIGKLKRELVK